MSGAYSESSFCWLLDEISEDIFELTINRFVAMKLNL